MPRENSEMQKARKRQVGRWGLKEQGLGDMEEGLSRRRRRREAKRVEKRKTMVDKRREDFEE